MKSREENPTKCFVIVGTGSAVVDSCLSILMLCHCVYTHWADSNVHIERFVFQIMTARCRFKDT